MELFRANIDFKLILNISLFARTISVRNKLATNKFPYFILIRLKNLRHENGPNVFLFLGKS